LAVSSQYFSVVRGRYDSSIKYFFIFLNATNPELIVEFRDPGFQDPTGGTW